MSGRDGGNRASASSQDAGDGNSKSKHARPGDGRDTHSSEAPGQAAATTLALQAMKDFGRYVGPTGSPGNAGNGPGAHGAA